MAIRRLCFASVTQGIVPHFPSTAQCVCKPTMKLDLSQLEPPPGGATLCNNATFEWMVNALLVEMSRLNQRAADLDAHTAKQQVSSTATVGCASRQQQSVARETCHLLGHVLASGEMNEIIPTASACCVF